MAEKQTRDYITNHLKIAADYRHISKHVAVNPNFVEALMLIPQNWTSLSYY